MAREIHFQVLSNRLTGEIQGQIRGLSEQAVRDSCERILVDIQRRMHQPGTGRIYVHGGIMHQASAPGRAPAAEFGDLIASYEIGIARTSDGPVGIVNSDSPYAAPLEYGAPARNLAPRPALTPAGEAERGKFQREAETKLKRGLE